MGLYFTQKLNLVYQLPEVVITRKDHSMQEPFLTLFSSTSIIDQH